MKTRGSDNFGPRHLRNTVVCENLRVYAPQGTMHISMNNMNNVNTGTGNVQAAGTAPKFCPECGSPVNGAKFCPNCGTKLV